MSSDGDALLRAVLEAPGDNGARRAYSDWLQERNDSVGTEGWFDAWYGRFINAMITNSELPEGGIWGNRLFGREVYDALSPFSWRLYGSDVVYHSKGSEPAEPSDTSAVAIGGFVGHVRMPQNKFLACAEILFRRHPVTSVWLTGAAPIKYVLDRDRYQDHFYFYQMTNPDFAHHVLPEIFQFLNGYTEPPPPSWGSRARFYPNRSKAEAALNLACVNLGRSRAELSYCIHATLFHETESYDRNGTSHY